MSSRARVVINELSRMVLGEFIDQAGFVQDLKSDIGLEKSKEESGTEEVGKDRLGKESFLDNFGLT